MQAMPYRRRFCPPQKRKLAYRPRVPLSLLLSLLSRLPSFT